MFKHERDGGGVNPDNHVIIGLRNPDRRLAGDTDAHSTDPLGLTVSRRKERFAWLDGARGFAAIAVMVYHFDGDLHFSPYFGSSFLAVDLFFVMSGFVLSHSYKRRLTKGRMSFLEFAKTRGRRLCPVYFFALVVGLVYFSLKIAMHTPDAPSFRSLIANLVANALFLPSLTPDPTLPGMFPFTPSAWSLSTEIFVSALFGAVLYRQSTPALAMTTLAALALFLVVAGRFGSLDLGWSMESFAAGLLRNFAEFCEGMLAYKVVEAGQGAHAPKWIGVSLSILVAVTFMHPLSSLLSCALSVTILFPLFLVICARQDLGLRASRACEVLGTLSYPLYILHTPVAMWIYAVWKLSFHTDPSKFSGRWFGFVLVGGALAISLLVGRHIDALTARIAKSRLPHEVR